MSKAANAMFELVRNVVDEPLSAEVKEQLKDSAFLENVLKLAAFHDIAPIVANALLEEKIIAKTENKLLSTANKYVMLAVYRYEQLEFVCREIYSIFEENKIPFIPLKGAFIRSMYKKPFLRTSCDADILVKSADAERATDLIRQKLNGRSVWASDHDITIFFDNDTHIELHFSFGDMQGAHRQVLERVWDTAKQANGYTYRYEMQSDIFYFYHLAHMAKHIKLGGCGIKPFIDLYLINQNGLNKGADETIEKGGLTRFCEVANELSLYLMTGKTPGDETMTLCDFILKGGTYGTVKNRVQVGEPIIEKNIFKTVFLPYNKLKYHYHVLYKHKWLYPFCIIRRMFKLAFKTLPDVLKKRRSGGASATESQATRDMIKNIGL